jgi:RNA polymerase sigma-70 factor (ECF subfamily)
VRNRRRLATAFLEARASSSGIERAGARDSLEAALVSAVERAREEWPSLPVDVVAWARHLAAHAPEQIGAEVWLSSAPVADLYVAFACASGDAEAMAVLERRCFGGVRAALASAGIAPSDVEEVLGVLRARLFVGSGGTPPRIATYSGRGTIAGWLKVAAVRLAVDEIRSTRASPERAVDAEVLERLAPVSAEPELAYLRARYRATFEDALKQALTALTPEQRTLLRLYYVDGVGVEKLGRMNGVHGSTISRWIARARGTLLREARRLVGAALAISDSEYESLLRLVRSGLHLSLARFLPEPASDSGKAP